MEVVCFGIRDALKMKDEPRTKVSRRIWWGLGLLAVLTGLLVGTAAFEAVTGRISGAVVQVRVDMCSVGKLNVTALSNKTVSFSTVVVPVSGASAEPPWYSGAMISYVRSRVWEAAGGGSHAFAFDKPESVLFHVKAGDILQLRPGQQTILMSWESSFSTERWAAVASVDP